MVARSEGQNGKCLEQIERHFPAVTCAPDPCIRTNEDCASEVNRPLLPGHGRSLVDRGSSFHGRRAQAIESVWPERETRRMTAYRIHSLGEHFTLALRVLKPSGIKHRFYKGLLGTKRVRKEESMDFNVGDRISQLQTGKARDYRTTGKMRKWKLYGTVIAINDDGRLRIAWDARGNQARRRVSLPSHSVQIETSLKTQSVSV